MAKFIKIAAVDMRSIAIGLLNGFPMLKTALEEKFPNAINFSKPLDPNFVVNKFMEALQDDEFSTMAFAAAQQFIAHRGKTLDILPEETYKNKGKYFQTRATPLEGMTPEMMPSIAAGGYQTTTGQMPKANELPRTPFSTIENEIKAKVANPNFQALDPAGKRKELSAIVKKYEVELAPFRQYLKKNLPVLGL